MRAINYDLACKRLSDKYLCDKYRQVIVVYIDKNGNTGCARVSAERLTEVEKAIKITGARYFGFYEIV